MLTHYIGRLDAGKTPELNAALLAALDLSGAELG